MKKQNSKRGLAASATGSEESKTWVYAFIILLLVSAWMLTMRLSNNPFLMLDFEIALVYLPTMLSGIVAAYLTTKSRRLK